LNSSHPQLPQLSTSLCHPTKELKLKKQQKPEMSIYRHVLNELSTCCYCYCFCCQTMSELERKIFKYKKEERKKKVFLRISLYCSLITAVLVVYVKHYDKLPLLSSLCFLMNNNMKWVRWSENRKKVEKNEKCVKWNEYRRMRVIISCYCCLTLKTFIFHSYFNDKQQLRDTNYLS
jgi:hypothetical protein